MCNDDSLALQTRRNGRYGAFFLMLGCAMLFTGMIGCFNVSIHFFFLNFMPMSAAEKAQLGLWRQMTHVMITFWPPLPLAGLGFAATGFFIRRGSARAMRIARWIALAGYGWGAALVINMALLLWGPWKDQMLGPFAGTEGGASIGMPLRIAQLVFAAGIGFGPATVLLWMLSKVRPLK